MISCKYQQDQRVPARPAADQQNTKGNSCHTPRTEAAGPSRTYVKPEKRAADQAHEVQRSAVACGHNSGHDRLQVVKDVPAAVVRSLNKAAYHCGLAGSLSLVAVACQSARRNRRFTSDRNIRRIIIGRAGLEAKSVFGVYLQPKRLVASTPRVRLTGRRERPEYSRRFENHPGNSGPIT